ncbi:preprotein translocase subunit SecG [Tessaracoccus lapidicaptus]|uniref:Protein-export membrane protein SecG n=1 Tax=Tessaracoccus lapidicaptus TaxID=1427523 RepID=A0A1C0AI47_9ACTN|nr:preprotein translocase subunit SecG [Tessaracoccus sp. T2.5-30]OCL31732.1 preprotein translocase subunit SecG [Tessaracoccus lapidicaptus]
MESRGRSDSLGRVIVPLVSWPVTTLSIIVIVLSVLLAATVLLHKSRGGGMSDLFGGGMSTSMGGVSTAERRLDRITVVLSLTWLLTIVGLLVLYRIGA